MRTLEAVRNYSGNATPEGMDVDKGVQRLAMLVVFAAFNDMYGKSHRFVFSENSMEREGRWKGLHSRDGDRWRGFKVCAEEIEEFEASPAFDWWVSLMGGAPHRWHEIFRDYNKDGDARAMLEGAAQRLRED